MKTKTINTVFRASHGKGKPIPKRGNHPPRNNKEIRVDIRIICEYSAKKNKAKVIAEYSTLYPETNSDSPSVRSKGALLVSAKAETKNITKAGNCGIMYQISCCPITIPVKFNSPLLITTANIISPIETS